MGCVKDGFVPAAILFDNPGITLEGIVEKMNQIDYGYAFDSKDQDNYGLSFGDLGGYLSVDCFRFNRGVFGAAELFLGLKPKVDLNNNDSRLVIYPRYVNGVALNPRYIFEKKVATRFGEPKEFDFDDRTPKDRKGGDLYPMGRGKINEDEFGFENIGDIIIDKIILAEDSIPDYNSEFDIMPQLKFAGREVIDKFKKTSFEDLDSLVSVLPEYAPNKIYDLSNNSGKLYPEHIYFSSGKVLKWIKRGEKYYLDLDHIFNNNLEFEYSSIVLTAEALRHKDFAMIRYQATRDVEFMMADFLSRHPDTIERHFNELANWWTCQYGKKNNLTWNELMGHRLLSRRKFDLAYEVAIFKEQAKLTEYKEAPFVPALGRECPF